MNKAYALALLSSLAAPLTTACVAETGEDVAPAEDELAKRADAEWFYTGAIPTLEQPKITVSLKGHTAHLTGLLPQGATLPSLPHVKTKLEAGRTRVDVVYPIATARPGKSNSRPGTYRFQTAVPYRPDGKAYTPQEGVHYVTWGGFPFIAYNNGIAFHGPITFTDNGSTDDEDVWILKRGAVSGGCNRMLGEHVVELTHAMGVNMRKVYPANQSFVPKTTATVTVIDTYDSYDGKWIDVDYPTDVGVVRPGVVYGSANVAMFGSWVASEQPNGQDLPPNMKWEGGVSGDWYVFSEHVLPNADCSAPKADLERLRAFVAKNGELPMNFCAKEACYLDALRAGKSPACK